MPPHPSAEAIGSATNKAQAMLSSPEQMAFDKDTAIEDCFEVDNVDPALTEAVQRTSQVVIEVVSVILGLRSLSYVC